MLFARITARILVTAAALSILVCPGAKAQLVTTVTAIPDTGKPPVVFVNGYQFGCTGTVTFQDTFGSADQLLARDSRASLFFNNCTVPNNPPIEDLGNEFGKFLESLRYSDGRPVPQVDVVAHSMGGMIVRSFIAGKQRERGVFTPPANLKIRKAVFLAVPFFGAVLADRTDLFPQTGVQATELQPGSAFVFDLNTWNQYMDDLRGLDAVAVVGTGGTGIVSGTPNFDDSTVSVTSASLDFARKGRTRVIPYCHTSLTGILSIACAGSAPAIARMTNDQHDGAKIMLSFLAGTNDWQSVGQSPADNNFLKQRAGLQLQFRSAQDAIVLVTAASVAGAGTMRIRSNEIAWDESLPAPGTLRISATTGVGAFDASINAAPGVSQAFIVTLGGPNITHVIPSLSDVYPRAVAPGGYVSLYGQNLAASEQSAGAFPYPTSLGGTEVRVNNQLTGVQYASPKQINILLPENTPVGLVKINVKTANGERNVNVLSEAVVPAVFGTAGNAVTGAIISADAPAHAGDYLSFYANGLGPVERRADGLDWALQQPQVSVGDKPCTVLFAGRAPGSPGLDQINCQLPLDVTPNDKAPVAITSGTRTANLTIPVR
jgi:uncharacterized protein (TIGR03437 family)